MILTLVLLEGCSNRGKDSVNDDDNDDGNTDGKACSVEEEDNKGVIKY